MIACVTAHFALPSLPEPLHSRVVSLVGLIVDELSSTAAEESFLLLTNT